MFVAGLPAASTGTNCWVLAPAAGAQCVVVDPGIGIVPGLRDLLREHRLQPAAVVLTHGHLDHTFSVRPVCGSELPAYVGPGDDWMIADPWAGLSPEFREMAWAQGLEWQEPDDVRPLHDGATVELAGVPLTVAHAPGHTPGSVLLSTATEQGEPLTLSGDVLFKGAVGRTDLPGGSWGQMVASLRDRVLPLPDETVVLPGHGETTTIGAERATNPYLREILLAG
ncbi:glyoxylase-like metal-dependent hydrolase (beta-lactamase superfamily II) [Motilibacter rhizosphaerae]|uniref:Glyoxylase-like metal-dependent hydrolase (Beta-lactamase superfamily II) n=1 Tax=Motilibacter rhizosphaerae TaxID=598652 RepID=A0A4Q7NQX7_9ACTN|nr:MBL fold metallo-hydrolase [Motilibacter rhizosphaerae]RZS89431.1 glyoxylase-like metal-dependent hydrolase (beta-lactamase superfamily II) [Motilibacter rhizosphaerae]